MTTDPPSPLGAVVSLLPLLLSPVAPELPQSVMSAAVLLRHKYLAPVPGTPNYLQATTSLVTAEDVERRREELSTRYIEDIRVSDVGYSGQMDEEGRLVARVTLCQDDEDTSLDLLVVWEEATPSSSQDVENTSNGMHEDRRSRQSKSADEGYDTHHSDDADDESAWRYYDLQLPQSSTKGWYPDAADALRAQQCLEAARTMTGNHSKRVSFSQDATSSRTELLKSYRERSVSVARPMHHEPETGLQGEEGPEPNANDYWAGCDSDDDEESDSYDDPSRRARLERFNEQVEDDYWAGYGREEPNIPDSHDHQASLDVTGAQAGLSEADTTDIDSRQDEMFGPDSFSEIGTTQSQLDESIDMCDDHEADQTAMAYGMDPPSSRIPRENHDGAPNETFDTDTFTPSSPLLRTHQISHPVASSEEALRMAIKGMYTLYAQSRSQGGRHADAVQSDFLKIVQQAIAD